MTPLKPAASASSRVGASSLAIDPRGSIFAGFLGIAHSIRQEVQLGSPSHRCCANHRLPSSVVEFTGKFENIPPKKNLFAGVLLQDVCARPLCVLSHHQKIFEISFSDKQITCLFTAASSLIGRAAFGSWTILRCGIDKVCGASAEAVPWIGTVTASWISLWPSLTRPPTSEFHLLWMNLIQISGRIFQPGPGEISKKKKKIIARKWEHFRHVLLVHLVSWRICIFQAPSTVQFLVGKSS